MRVLIIKLSSLGDVIHAMPAVQDIRAAIENVQIDWVVEPSVAPLVRRVEGIDEVIEAPLRRWVAKWWRGGMRQEFRALREQLTQYPYDAMLDMQGLTKSAVISRLARLTANGHRYGLANRTRGSSWEPAARWLVDTPIRVERRIHAMDRCRALAERALGYSRQGAPRYGLCSAVPESPQPVPQVVFIHGSSRGDKAWPEERWIALGQRLVTRGVGIGLPQANTTERERAQRIAKALGSHAEVWPAMNVDAVVDRLVVSRGVIGIDSGLSHIAVALDLPHVQLYNFPTAWRTGPQAAHGHAHQVSVQGDPWPTLDAVWGAWCSVHDRARGVGS